MIIPPMAPDKTAIHKLNVPPNEVIIAKATIMKRRDDPIVPIRSATSGLLPAKHLTA